MKIIRNLKELVKAVLGQKVEKVAEIIKGGMDCLGCLVKVLRLAMKVVIFQIRLVVKKKL